MIRAIAYRLQEIAHGGLSKVTLRRLATLEAEFDTSGTISAPEGPRIKSGSVSFENGTDEPMSSPPAMRASSSRVGSTSR